MYAPNLLPTLLLQESICILIHGASFILINNQVLHCHPHPLKHWRRPTRPSISQALEPPQMATMRGNDHHDVGPPTLLEGADIARTYGSYVPSACSAVVMAVTTTTIGASWSSSSLWVAGHHGTKKAQTIYHHRLEDMFLEAINPSRAHFCSKKPA
ncbi:hypothetical protein CPB85DRAFT_1253202 [Mucidula mucida]|nr:hypothetical protein CPB85DRAFT_1253202 [Mucidula mucida]